MDWEQFTSEINNAINHNTPSAFMTAYSMVFGAVSNKLFDSDKFVAEFVIWFKSNYSEDKRCITIVKCSMRYFERITYLFNPNGLLRNWRFKQVLPKLLENQQLASFDPIKLRAYLILGLNLNHPCILAIAYTNPNLL